jgi:hypothetical protein
MRKKNARNQTLDAKLKPLNQSPCRVEDTAQDRVKYLLTIKRNERSPSSEIPAHHRRNAHLEPCETQTGTEQRDISRRTGRNGRRGHGPKPAPDDGALRYCRPAARWTGPVWFAPAGEFAVSRPFVHPSSVIAGVLHAGGRRNRTQLRSSMATRQILRRWASSLKHAVLGRGPVFVLKRGVRCCSLARIQALEPLLL